MNDQCSVFCGRSCSGCVGCPWGWFANPPHLPRDPQVTINQTLNAQCQPCTDTFDAYDWLFVIFHILCALLLHYQAIWRLSVTKPRTILTEYFSATIEVLGGFMLTIIVLPPFGSININACYSSSIIQEDINQYWYNNFPDSYYVLMPPSTFFYDPFHDELDSTRCFYEVIYPRFSLPLIGLCLSLIITATIRPLVLYCSIMADYDKMPYLYKALSSTLVAYPMYTLVMCVMSGTIYKYYAYLLLFFALIQISFYAAYASNQKYSRLVTSNERLLHIPFITCHFVLLALSAWSYTSRKNDAKVYNTVFPMIVIPLLFLFLTDNITNARTARLEANPDTKEHANQRAATTVPNDSSSRGAGFSGFVIDQSSRTNCPSSHI